MADFISLALHEIVDYLPSYSVLLSVVLLAVFSILIVFLLYLVWVRRLYSHIPSPPMSNFFVGHLPDLAKAAEHRPDQKPIHKIFSQWHEESGGGPLFVVHFIFIPLICCMDPDNAKELFVSTKHSKPYAVYKWMQQLCGERYLGQGLVTILDYKTWKPRRKLYDPAFNKGYLKELVSSFNSCMDTMLNTLRPLADGKTEVPMRDIFSNTTLHVISQAGFSTDFIKEWKPGLRENESLSSLVKDSLIALQKQLAAPYLPYEYLHPFQSKEHAKSIRALRKIGRNCIKKRIESLERGDTLPNDILTCMLRMAQNEEKVDIELLVDDFVTFFIAGQDTSGNAVCFSMILTLQHPQVLNRLLEEIDEVVGDKQTITANDLDRLQYTEQVLMESIRMYPPVPQLSKCSTIEGMTLCGHHIPGNTLIALPFSTYCRMPKYFSDPEQFDPDRFEPGKKLPSSFVFFPFGAGHRSCIGKHFAIMESKLLLARLFQSFTITLPDDYEVVAVSRATLQPKDSVPCKLQLRDSMN